MKYTRENPLTTLPPKADDLFASQVEKWTSIGLKTGPIRREDARIAMQKVYENPIRPVRWHGNVIFCDSPLSLALTDAIVREGLKHVGKSVGDSVRSSVGASVMDSVGDSVIDSVGASVWDSVGASVGDSVGASVWDSVSDSVGVSVGASVRSSVVDSVGASVWDPVRSSVIDSVGASVWDSVRSSMRSSVRESTSNFHHCGWLSFYDTFNNLGVCTDAINGLIALTSEAGFWIARERVALIAENPKWIDLDEFGRLHSDSRAAIEYPDGWGVFAIGGVVVPEKVVMAPELLTAEEITKERNAEVRRIMIERFGPDKFFEETGATVVSGDFVEVTRGGRKMPRFLLADNAGDKWLIGTDGSTRRTYTMPVPRAVTTCREAHEAICGLDERKCVGQS